MPVASLLGTLSTDLSHHALVNHNQAEGGMVLSTIDMVQGHSMSNQPGVITTLPWIFLNFFA